MKSKFSIHSYAVASLNNEVYIFGGQTSNLDVIATVAKLDRDQNWSIQNRLVEARRGHSAILVSSNKILIIGGEDSRYKKFSS